MGSGTLLDLLMLRVKLLNINFVVALIEFLAEVGLVAVAFITWGSLRRIIEQRVSPPVDTQELQF
jgi:hypothetical protein